MEDGKLEPPRPSAFLRAGGFTAIVLPGECGCRLDDLMPCGQPSMYRDSKTGIPKGCLPGYAHSDPSGKTNDWIASTEKKPPTQDEFDMWIE